MRPALRNTRLFLELSDKILRSGRQLQFRAAGFSMRPTIQDGDLVRVESVKPDHIRIGNIVLCRRGAAPVVHRVVGIRKGIGRMLLTLRGDALAAPDAPVEAHQVLGRVLAVHRGGRFVEVESRRAPLACRIHSLARRLKRSIFSPLSLLRLI